GVAPIRAQPLVLVETGAAVPVSRARAALDPGGSLALGGGFRWRLSPQASVSLVGAGASLLFDYECGDRTKRCSDDKLATILSLTGGPRLSLHDGDFELFFGARGGYYRGISGGRSGNAGGFGIEAGFHYELVPGSTAGALIR